MSASTCSWIGSTTPSRARTTAPVRRRSILCCGRSGGAARRRGRSRTVTEGAVLLRDRTTGEGMSLAQTWLSYTGSALWPSSAGFVELVLRNGRTRLVSLPDFTFIDLPRNVRLIGPAGDDRWLVGGRSGGPYGLSDLRDAEAITPLWSGGSALQIQGDRLLVQDIAPCCLDEQARSDTGPVWAVPFDGSAPRRLSDDVARRPGIIDERRMFARVDVDAQDRGTLLLVDLETRGEQVIDEAVGQTHGMLPSLDEGRYWYTVRDGERAGVWVIRLPE